MPTPWGILATIMAFYYQRKMVDSAQNTESRLTFNEKIVIVVLLLIEPIWSGLVLFLGLRSVYPQKAQQIAKYAIAIVILQILVVAAIMFFFFAMLVQFGPLF